MEAISDISAIESFVLKNTDYIHVIRTSESLQITAMHVPYGGEIPAEAHIGVTQMMYIMDGSTTLITSDFDEEPRYGTKGDIMWINPGVRHHVISGHALRPEVPGEHEWVMSPCPHHGDFGLNQPLKLFSVYAPASAEHDPDQIVRDYPGQIYPTHVHARHHHHHHHPHYHTALVRWL